MHQGNKSTQRDRRRLKDSIFKLHRYSAFPQNSKKLIVRKSEKNQRKKI